MVTRFSHQLYEAVHVSSRFPDEKVTIVRTKESGERKTLPRACHPSKGEKRHLRTMEITKKVVVLLAFAIVCGAGKETSPVTCCVRSIALHN